MLPFIKAVKENLVKRFLENDIKWTEISEKLEELMNKHETSKIHSLDDILHFDGVARRLAESA